MHSKRCCMNDPARITNSINYKNDFALATWAPLSLCEDGKAEFKNLEVHKLGL
ncbi:hypothetical protein [Segatella sp.]|uniref:hypothetical protein n=1 Tax=Segatella sp. TaxID=2974253 RepID=UPI003AB9533A